MTNEPDTNTITLFDVLVDVAQRANRIDMLASQLCGAVHGDVPAVREYYVPDSLHALAVSLQERLNHIDEMLDYRVLRSLGGSLRDVPTDAGEVRGGADLAFGQRVHSVNG